MQAIRSVTYQSTSHAVHVQSCSAFETTPSHDKRATVSRNPTALQIGLSAHLDEMSMKLAVAHCRAGDDFLAAGFASPRKRGVRFVQPESPQRMNHGGDGSRANAFPSLVGSFGSEI
jgi:hypothetical protein